MLILDIFKTKMENPLINSDDCYSIYPGNVETHIKWLNLASYTIHKHKLQSQTICVWIRIEYLFATE